MSAIILHPTHCTYYCEWQSYCNHTTVSGITLQSYCNHTASKQSYYCEWQAPRFAHRRRPPPTCRQPYGTLKTSDGAGCGPCEQETVHVRDACHVEDIRRPHLQGRSRWRMRLAFCARKAFRFSVMYAQVHACFLKNWPLKRLAHTHRHVALRGELSAEL